MRNIISQLSTKIYNSDYINRHKRCKRAFTRSRKLPSSVLIWSILRLVKRSLALECLETLWEECGGSVTKQAFSQARYKFSHTGFIELHQDTLDVIYEDKEFGRWRGYRLIGADGSSLRLPDTNDVVEKFGYHKPNNTGGKMPPIGRVSLFVDLCLLNVVSARLSNWSFGERTIAKEQLPEIVDTLNQDNLLFVYDRGYTSVEYMKQHIELGVDFLFRVSSSSYKKLWQRAKAGERDFNDKVQGVNVRVVVVELNTGEIELLITSVSEEKLSTLDISKLYTLRWQLEECYKKLKVNLELENFSGNNLEAVLQDFWAHMVIHNVAMYGINEKQEPLKPDKLSTNRINYPIFFGVLRDSIFKVIHGQMSMRKFNKKLERATKIAKNKIKPGRSFSREKMKIPKRHKVFFRTC